MEQDASFTRTLSVVPDEQDASLGSIGEVQEINPEEPPMATFVPSEPTEAHINLLGVMPLSLETAERLFTELGVALKAAGVFG